MTIHAAVIVLVHVALAAVGIWLTAIDARTHRLPNRIVLPTLASLFALVLLEGALTGDAGKATASVIGMLALAAFFAALHVMSGQGMGGGDVKLAAAIGLLLGWHGWQALLVGVFSTFLLGAGYALVLLGLRRVKLETRIAFGPWMIIGAVLGVAAS